MPILARQIDVFQNGSKNVKDRTTGRSIPSKPFEGARALWCAEVSERFDRAEGGGFAAGPLGPRAHRQMAGEFGFKGYFYRRVLR